MCRPVITANGTVIRTSEQCKLLIEGGFVLTTVDSKRHTLARYEIIHVRNVAPIVQHFQKR